MTRDDHIKLCKQRANEYLKRGDVSNAINSMLSDLDKHSETREVGAKMSMDGMICVIENDLDKARRFINDFS
jgi:hypothetical protein